MKNAKSTSALDARGVMRVSASRCDRERALFLAGFDPDDIAAQIFDLPDQAFQSPLALALGTQFESQLYRDNAKRLIKAYVAIGRLDVGARVSDLTRDPNRVARTLRFIEARLAGGYAPDVIIQGGLSLEAFGAQDSVIRPDALVSARGEKFYRPAEVKSYESRGGFTSEDDIESAAAQAAVSLFALRHVDSAYATVDFVDIILRKSSSMLPIIHAIPAARDMHRLQLAARTQCSAAEALVAFRSCPDSAIPEFRAAVQAIPTHYEPSCLQRCGFARRCRSDAHSARDPRVIDGDASALLVGTLDLLNNSAELAESYEGRLIKRALEAADDAIA